MLTLDKQSHSNAHDNLLLACVNNRLPSNSFCEALRTASKKDDIQQMSDQLREGIVQSKPQVMLEGEVECDEAYVIAGHKGQPDAVQKGGEKDVGGG